MATTYSLAIGAVFKGLAPQEQRYAHHMARAAWHGTRVLLRQTYPESEGIYDFILELHKACQGNWSALVNDQGDVRRQDVDAFLEYAAQFLAHLGNYYCVGDRKVVPAVSADALRKMADVSPSTRVALEKVIKPMLDPKPYVLGYPGKTTLSAYYPDSDDITKEEIATVAAVMKKYDIMPENTRVRKYYTEGTTPVFEILKAAAEVSDPTRLEHNSDAIFQLRRGDYNAELSKACAELEKAA